MTQPIELVESVPEETTLGLSGTRRTADVWLEMIGGAHETLDIETFYFVGKRGSIFDSVMEAVAQAAGRGVRVRILTDEAMTETYPKWLAVLGETRNVETRVISTFNERSGVLHAKHLVVDHEQIFVGSQNFDWRALVHIHELGIRVRNADLARRFEELFAYDWEMAARKGRNPIEIPRNRTCGADERLAAPIEIGMNGGRTVTILPAASPIGLIPPGMRTEEEVLVSLLDEARERLSVQLLLYSPVVAGGYYGTLDSALRRAAALSCASSYLTGTSASPISLT
jgi:hypothetical protein